MLVDLFQPMLNETAIKQKVQELTQELKLAGLWKQEEPVWVNQFHENDDFDGSDFYEWLQFVYLPNLLSTKNRNPYNAKKAYIAPQAVQFLRHEIERTRLLQLLVELDALTD